MSKMAFEVYDKIGQSQCVPASGVRLAKDGIHFTKKFTNENYLQMYSYIVFYYDKDSKRIGFSFQNTFEKGKTYKLINLQPKSRSLVYKCGAQSFLRHYNIMPDKSHHYNPTKDDGMFIIQLEEI